MLSVASELGVARPRVRGFPSCHSFSILGDSTLIQNLQRFLQFSEVATVNLLPSRGASFATFESIDSAEDRAVREEEFSAGGIYGRGKNQVP